ncbi:MAG: hypothetical protein ACRESC_04695 [Gammaproteobacteria bacterium]
MTIPDADHNRDCVRLNIGLLLSQYRIDLEEVAAHCGSNAADVAKALDLSQFLSCPFLEVAMIWAAVERLLHERGWQGDHRNLWWEFDARMGFPKLGPGNRYH